MNVDWVQNRKNGSAQLINYRTNIIQKLGSNPSDQREIGDVDLLTLCYPGRLSFKIVQYQLSGFSGPPVMIILSGSWPEKPDN